MKLKNKTVLITGASSGIGAKAAETIGGMGNTVILLARREQKLKSVTDSIVKSGGKVFYYPVDLADSEATQTILDQIKQEAGIPDIIINNAGLGKWMTIRETSNTQAREMISLPYLAAFSVTKAFLPEMIERKSGHIINLTSDASFLPKGNAIAYSAARFALRGFTEALRSDLLGTGVNVSLAVFGKVDSSYWENNPGSEEKIPAPTPFMPTLTTSQVAGYLVNIVEKNKRILIKPGVFKLLFWAFRHWPDAIARGMKN